MKNILALAFLLLSIMSFSQTGRIKKKDKSFQVYSYEECIKKFEGIKDKTFEIKKKLAESYYKIGDFYKAEDYYKGIVDSPKSNSEDVYNYASVLLRNQKYKDVEIWMEKFSNMEKCDSRAKRFLLDKEYYFAILNDEAKFKINNLEINTESQDFGTSFYLDKIVFASSRPSSKFFKRIWTWNQLPFLDLFIADVKRSQLIDVKQFKKKLNKKYDESSASFSKDGKFMAFTQNNYSSKSEDEIIKLQIFTSQKEGDRWDDAISLPFNNPNYSVGHPSLTADGSKMYFASDMPGGFGGADIYVVEKDKLGSWGKPQNLGSEVNTEGDEMFPFIHENGMLFFASNGLLGIGGLDIFYTKLHNNKFKKPKNIGVPVNSSFDDFSFIIDKQMKKGYFSSNREGGKGDDDIYSFKLLKELTFDAIIKGQTLDKNGNILANTNVSLFDNDGNIIKSTNSDEDGNYGFEVSSKNLNKLMASKPKYITDIKEIKYKEEQEVIEMNLVLEQLPDFTILCNVYDDADKKTISDVQITSIDNYLNKKTSFKTFEDGEFLIQLNDYKLNDSVNFTFILEKDGYASKYVDYKKMLRWIGEYKLKVKMQKMEIGKDLGKILEINPIYFDFDKSNIRPDAAIELDKIVSVMNKYPNMVIELSSHTDCRGSGIYNLKLSDRRAKSSAFYIKTRISKPTRIYGEGFGEKKLINDCGCESNIGKGLGCSEEQHQQNRRTEFKIIRK